MTSRGDQPLAVLDAVIAERLRLARIEAAHPGTVVKLLRTYAEQKGEAPPDDGIPEGEIACSRPECVLHRETQLDEIATNLRIAQRIGIWQAIEDGKSYEDAEVELFDSLRAEVERLESELSAAREEITRESGKFHAETRARSAQFRAVRKAVDAAFIMNDQHRARIIAALEASYNEPFWADPARTDAGKEGK